MVVTHANSVSKQDMLQKLEKVGSFLIFNMPSGVWTNVDLQN